MRTIEYWEKRYDEFCHEVLGKEINFCGTAMYCVMDEIMTMEEYFKEKTENKEHSPEEVILFLYINHELNLFDALWFAYPSIWYEYSVYAWQLVDGRLKNGGEQFHLKVKEQVEYLNSTLGFFDNHTVKTTCYRINQVVNEIYERLNFIKKLHKKEFSEELFWKKQLKLFRYKVLGGCRKEYAYKLTFLTQERDHLIKNKDENMKGNYKEFILFLYINNYLNSLDPTRMYYPQFPYQYEKYAWEIVKAYKNCNAIEFPMEAEKIIVDMYEGEGIPWKKHLHSIRNTINKMKEHLNKVKKNRVL